MSELPPFIVWWILAVMMVLFTSLAAIVVMLLGWLARDLWRNRNAD